MQKLKQHKALESQGLAAVTLTLHWADGHAEHEDSMHLEKFSAWREIDFLPPAIASRIVGMQAGDSVESAVPAGEVTGAWDAQCQVSGDPSGFDRTYRHGLAITPRVGRFYPQGFFHGFSNIVRAAVEPARITALDIQTMHVDLNHPFARFPFRLVFRLEHVLPGVDTRRGRCNSPLDNLVRYPGLAAPLSGGLLTDYGDDERGMSRMDERDDSAFYSRARLVQHLDTRALATVNALYKRLVPVHADVLDLMASFDSHLEGCSLHSLHLLGMNADELQANRPASTRILQDLNVQHELPFEAASLDAVICTASVEYLIQPCRLFAEVLRILRPGGIFVLTFSNRCFPTKAIHVWSELHEFERVGMVTQWLQQAGFVDLHTLSSCGWPRPEGDAHSDRIAASDPVYACWGFSPVQ